MGRERHPSGGGDLPAGFTTFNEDTLDGGAGDDLIFGDYGHDVIEGGDGNDTIRGDGDLPASSYGEYCDDRLSGGVGNDVVFGDYGNDAIDGGDGSDTLRGDDGDDFIDGGENRHRGAAEQYGQPTHSDSRWRGRREAHATASGALFSRRSTAPGNLSSHEGRTGRRGAGRFLGISGSDPMLRTFQFAASGLIPAALMMSAQVWISFSR